ncbi:MAG: phosphoenolpyruvate--protein phosphotransferase [Eubacteriales bacterium]
MNIIYGKGASGGIAAGTLKIIRREKTDVSDEICSDLPAELAKLHAALGKAEDELTQLYTDAVEKVGEREAAIFEIHKMMLADEDFVTEAENFIRNEKNTAASAVRKAGTELARIFGDMEDEYMKARAADILAVSERVTDILGGCERSIEITHPSVIAAHDLTPAETVMLDKKMVLGFVTEGGSTMSHTAILARTMDIPAVIGIGELPDRYDGCPVVLDGNEGVLYIEPDEHTENRFAEAMREAEDERKRLERLRGKTCVTSDGTRIMVTANVGSLEDIDEALRCDAEGIGLFRSEFLFMGRNKPPTEEEQFALYKSAAIKTGGRECVIRTLDAGADKHISYLTGEGREANPALGLRAVRLCLKKPELLKTQFRALYRAALFGNLAAMIPMIVLPEEIDQVREIARAAQDSLAAEHTAFGKMKVGIMIETPSAALLADRLAPMTDFFSLGTNDLLQYTLAADRENPDVSYLTKGLPESVRRLIRSTCAAARREGIPVSVCGELGADTSETKFLMDAGVTKLSVSPPCILRVRESVMRESSRLIPVR